MLPSTDLRRWYHHEAAQWNEFRKRYFAEVTVGTEPKMRWLPGCWRCVCYVLKLSPCFMPRRSSNRTTLWR